MVRFQSIKRKFPFPSLFPPCPQGVTALSRSTINPAPSREHDDHGQNLLHTTTDRRAQQQAGQASQGTRALLLLCQAGDSCPHHLILFSTSVQSWPQAVLPAVPGTHQCHQATPSCSQHPTRGCHSLTNEGKQEIGVSSLCCSGYWSPISPVMPPSTPTIVSQWAGLAFCSKGWHQLLPYQHRSWWYFWQQKLLLIPNLVFN